MNGRLFEFRNMGGRMKTGTISTLIRMGAIAACAVAGAAQAADLPSVKEPVLAPIEAPAPWFFRLGVGGVLFNSSASLTLGGATVPGASAHASNNVTAIVEFGYFINDNLSVQLTAGYPPTTSLSGRGVIAPLGTLGKATYGPAVLSLDYHITNFGAFRPYLGIGVVDALVLSTQDGAVHHLAIPSAGGWAVEGGFDYYLNRNWSLFADAKYLFLSASATGNALGAPVTAVVRLDPTIVTGGIGYHW